MARRPKAPKPIPISTLKAVAACHAVGLTYHGGTGATLAAVDDAQGYHWVKVSTTAGVARAMHWCCNQRTGLAATAAAMPSTSREFTRAELALVTPSWLCDSRGGWVDVPSTDGIMAAAGLDFTVEVSE
jgi:hypothetical protein